MPRFAGHFLEGCGCARAHRHASTCAMAAIPQDIGHAPGVIGECSQREFPLTLPSGRAAGKRRIAQNTLLDRSEGMLDQRAAPLHHPLSYSTSMLHRHSRSSFREERNLVQIPIQVEVELEQIGRIDGRTRPLPAGLDLPNPSRRMSSPPTHRSITRTMCSAVSVL